MRPRCSARLGHRGQARAAFCRQRVSCGDDDRGQRATENRMPCTVNRYFRDRWPPACLTAPSLQGEISARVIGALAWRAPSPLCRSHPLVHEIRTMRADLSLTLCSLPLCMAATLACTPSASPGSAPEGPQPARRVLAIDLASSPQPRDRFAELSVGSDYPGTLIRDETLAQLRLVRQELGFRTVRFHDVFHDSLGTYREVGGRPVYDWTKIDYLYDQLLAMGMRPFVE